MAHQWFAEVLRDGFALAAAGAAASFSTIAAATAARLLSATSSEESVPAAVEHIMDGFSELDVHPDVPDGIRALRSADVRLITLSNGGTEVAHGLLERAGLRHDFEALLSVQDAPRWKPAQQAYAHALRYGRVAPADMMLVAVHPWDIDGAARAGLRTAWVNRSGGSYPDFFHPPEIAVGSLVELAGRWARD